MWYTHEPLEEANETRLGATGLKKWGVFLSNREEQGKGKELRQGFGLNTLLRSPSVQPVSHSQGKGTYFQTVYVLIPKILKWETHPRIYWNSFLYVDLEKRRHFVSITDHFPTCIIHHSTESKKWLVSQKKKIQNLRLFLPPLLSFAY